METKEKTIISENNNIPRTKMQIDEAALQSIEPAAVLDSAIVPIRDFVSPEELHRDLIEIIQKYHPSADISMVERHIRLLRKHIRRRCVNPENRILSIHYMWPLFWRSLRWIRKQSWRDCFMT